MVQCALFLALRQNIAQEIQIRKQERNDASVLCSSPGNPEVFEAVMQVKAIRHGNVRINANVNSFVPQAGKS